MGDAGLKLMEQFGEDEKLLQIFLKPWFKVSNRGVIRSLSSVGNGRKEVHLLEVLV